MYITYKYMNFFVCYTSGKSKIKFEKRIVYVEKYKKLL